MLEDESVLACFSNPKQAACMRSLVALAKYIQHDLGGISEEHATILLNRAESLASRIAEEASPEKALEIMRAGTTTPGPIEDDRVNLLSEDMQKSSKRAQDILRWCIGRISYLAIQKDWSPELMRAPRRVFGPEDKKRMPRPRTRKPAAEPAPPRPKRTH
jgi:hypothetical protein